MYKLWSGRGRIRAIRWKCRVSDILVHVSFRDQHRRTPPWPWLIVERFWEKPRKLRWESYGCWESWVERSGWTRVRSVKCWGLCCNGRHVQREREDWGFEKTTTEVTVIQFYSTSLIYTYAYFRRGIIDDRVVPFGSV